MTPANRKFISVIIPVYNDAEGIKTTLESLLKQDYPRENYEIIVADNDSGDDTLEVIRQFRSDYPELIKLVYERNVQSSYAARNRGIEIARGDIICFLDSDEWAGGDWLSAVDKFFEEHGVDYAGYAIDVVIIRDNLVSQFHRMIGFPAEKYLRESNFAVTAALSVKRRVFEKAGMFDVRLFSGGDREFGHRVSGKGFKLAYCPDNPVSHPAFSGLRKIGKKFFRIGRGCFQLNFYYPRRYESWGLIDGALFLPPHPFKIKQRHPGWLDFSPWKKIIFYFLLWYTKVLVVSGYYYEKIKSHDNQG